MKKASLGIIASALCFGLSLSAPAANISIACGGVGKELLLCKTHAGAWANKTGHTVTIVDMPKLVTDQLALHQLNSRNNRATADVIQVDVIWPSLLADDFIDLSHYVDQETLNQHFEAIVAINQVNGQLVGIPWFTDLGILLYRKDLLNKYQLPVPTTWTELARTAKKIQDKERQAGNPKMWGFIWQGKASEGLTCNALEWISSYRGGTLMNEQGQSTVYNPPAIKAINRAADWIGTISPPAVLTYSEAEAREQFEQGHAVFMRHWPRAWHLSQLVESLKGHVGVSVLPKGGSIGQQTSTLGGWQLSVSKYSKHKKAAVELILYLTSQSVQKARAMEGSYLPTIKALYQDQEVLEKFPFFSELDLILENNTMVVRPSNVTDKPYDKVSRAFWNAVHSVLSGRANAGDSLKRLSKKLNAL
jgi:trehalose/maltose transport system substrate-binding protein